jgi:hypothetical protein
MMCLTSSLRPAKSAKQVLNPAKQASAAIVSFTLDECEYRCSGQSFLESLFGSV